MPYLASLNAGHHFCGGTLIDKNWVLTSAACAVYAQQSQVPVQACLGEHNINVDEGTEQL